jgi:hypothetical protein
MLMLRAHLCGDWKAGGVAGSMLAVACTETRSCETGNNCDDRTDCIVDVLCTPCSYNNPS